MPASRIPRIDFSLIPPELEGFWVVLRVGPQQKVLGHGRTPDQAFQASGVSEDDLTAILTEVPADMPIAYVGQSEPE